MFLSTEWVAALDRAARTSSRLADCATDRALVVEQRILLADGSEHAHHVVLEHDGARVMPGRAGHPDIVLYSDLATARDLALGTTNAQHALTAGRLRVRGDVSALLTRRDELRALDDVFATVRADTTFPPSDGATVTSTR